ncbi:hypothetical protein AB0478_46130 [Streptomyces sp. NPDC051917]
MNTAKAAPPAGGTARGVLHQPVVAAVLQGVPGTGLCGTGCLR